MIYSRILKGQIPPFKVKCNKEFESLIRLCWKYDIPEFYQIEQVLLMKNDWYTEQW